MPTPVVPTPHTTLGSRGPIYADVFVARYRVTCPLLVAKDPSGRLHHRYRGELLDFLNDEQRAHFLRLGLVEELVVDDGVAAVTMPPAVVEPASSHDAPQPPARPLAGHDANADVVEECVRDLDRLGVPKAAGAPAARTALREGGLRYANDLIAVAVRVRKQQPPSQPEVRDDG